MPYRFTEEEYHNMAMCYAQAGEICLRAKELYAERYGKKVNSRTILGAVQRYKETGSYKPRMQSQGRPAHPAHIEEAVIDYFNENPGASNEDAAREFGVSNFYVWRLLRNEGIQKKKAEEIASEHGEGQAQQIPKEESPQKLDPMETIFLFQAQNEDALKTDVEIKKEPIVYEVGPSKPPLELEIEYEPNTSANLQNLVLAPEDLEVKSGLKKSARLEAKEVQNQAKILEGIQKTREKKIETNIDQSDDDSDSDSDSENDGGEEDSGDETQDQEQEIETTNAVLFLENELKVDQLDIKEENTLETNCLEIQNGHINGIQYEECTPIVTDRKVNETDNKGRSDQTDGLLVERASVPVVDEKRKRGRPRKYIENKPIVTEKRKRGRPPKPKDITNKFNTDTTVKRKRGRPPKAKVTTATNEIPVSTASTQENEEDSGEEYTVFISEDVIEEPIHLEVQGVINFLV